MISDTSSTGNDEHRGDDQSELSRGLLDTSVLIDEVVIDPRMLPDESAACDYAMRTAPAQLVGVGTIARLLTSV